jgi:hypothetical protein
MESEGEDRKEYASGPPFVGPGPMVVVAGKYVPVRTLCVHARLRPAIFRNSGYVHGRVPNGGRYRGLIQIDRIPEALRILGHWSAERADAAAAYFVRILQGGGEAEDEDEEPTVHIYDDDEAKEPVAQLPSRKRPLEGEDDDDDDARFAQAVDAVRRRLIRDYKETPEYAAHTEQMLQEELAEHEAVSAKYDARRAAAIDEWLVANAGMIIKNAR